MGRERVNGLDLKGDGWYYVELFVGGDRITRAVVTPASTLREAVRLAREDAADAHPGEDVEIFMTRTITPEKAERILDRFDDGTWEGWTS